MTDLGLTHIALEVTDIEKSVEFYKKYAQMIVVHRRKDETINSDVAWISDLTRPFVIVLIKMPKIVGKLMPQSHLGVAVNSKEKVDEICLLASTEGILLSGPNDWESPVGYWAYIQDPDGHTLEISFGQKIHFTLENF
ncbi:VOC family protein [Geminocystis sp. NIES-3709]|uniref:VOC family protein n=1 Tax=Geminocystis sp. NIES-3709 TaxID=1617448 RepID=UPI0005FC9B5D|nr:VOC family protein [Geminocystis sp. NIES-3709]BAQ63329.1 glyoxalase/bleomycin resistance protein/dioxygenase domain [Geminocystis sp. NIES-3709]